MQHKIEITRTIGMAGEHTGTLEYNLTDSGKVGAWSINWKGGRAEAGNLKGRLTLARWMEANGLTERKARPRKAATVKSVGFWIVGIDESREIMKWGRDGNCEFPFPPETTKAQLDEEVAWLKRQPAEKGFRHYILEVFDNGQMKQSYATENAGM